MGTNQGMNPGMNTNTGSTGYPQQQQAGVGNTGYEGNPGMGGNTGMGGNNAIASQGNMGRQGASGEVMRGSQCRVRLGGLHCTASANVVSSPNRPLYLSCWQLLACLVAACVWGFGSAAWCTNCHCHLLSLLLKVVLLQQLLVHLLSGLCLSTAGAMGPQGGMPGMNQMGAQGGGQVRSQPSLLAHLLPQAEHSTAQQCSKPTAGDMLSMCCSLA